MADASSSMRPGEIAASRVRKLAIRLLGNVDLGERHSCEVPENVEIDDS